MNTRIGVRLFGPFPGGLVGDPTASAMTTIAPVAALVATLGLAGVSWVVVVRQMSGMDMGVATRLGSFGSFVGVWLAMMAAMMLPGAAPAVIRQARGPGGVGGVPIFVGSYLAVWTLAGAVIYMVYRPHGTVAAGVIVLAAGVYEFTTLKRGFRSQCHQRQRSGLGFGLCCVGSSIGVMAMMAAIGVMSVTWMTVVAVVTIAQKLLPARASLDVPLALAIAGFGVLILIAPSTVPGLMMSM